MPNEEAALQRRDPDWAAFKARANNVVTYSNEYKQARSPVVNALSFLCWSLHARGCCQVGGPEREMHVEIGFMQERSPAFT